MAPRRLTSSVRRAIIGAIVEAAFATRRFYILLGLASTIAAFGLLSNSAAVIIGAMIIAPLMGPILGLSLGMLRARRHLERGALIAEVTGVALAVAIGFVAGRLPLNLGISAEMIARTAPTAYDLAIAFASGLAGAYVSVNRKVNSAIAGVAISVALVPPLVTSGLLMSVGHRREALGAFLLFAANFVSIQLASALVFGLYGFGRWTRRRRAGSAQFVLRFAPPVAALFLMAWVMTGTLVGLVRDHREEEVVERILTEEIAKRSGGRLDRVLRRDRDGNRLEIVASALTPRVFETSQVAAIQAELGGRLAGPVHLVLRSVVSQDVDAKGRVYIDEGERSQSAKAQADAEFLGRAGQILRDDLAREEDAELDGVERRDRDGRAILVATVRTPVAITPDRVADLEDALREALGDELRLIVRNVVTRDTDRSGFLYEAKPEESPKPDPEIEALRRTIRSVLERRMGAIPARRVIELRLDRTGGRIFARAVVEATEPVRPSEVSRIQADLVRYVDPRLGLAIRTVLAAEADADGWIAVSAGGGTRGPGQ